MDLTDDERSEIESPGLNNSRKVAILARLALQRLGSTSPEKPAYSPEIRDLVKKIYPDIFHNIADSTFIVYLSQAPGEDQRIISLGTARGYYLDQIGATTVKGEEPIAELPATDDASIEVAPVAPAKMRLEKEARLYPHIENWLIVNGYRSRVVAQGKSLGPWGNPDVVGIQALDILGSWQAQTVSVEVKLSSQHWQRDVFEAISHRRYFDRCYFSYPVLENNLQVSEEMKDYAELYQIGILLVELAQQELDKLNKAEELDPSYLTVREVCPAPYRAVMPRYRREAFAALDIHGLESLFNWGRRAGD